MTDLDKQLNDKNGAYTISDAVKTARFIETAREEIFTERLLLSKNPVGAGYESRMRFLDRMEKELETI